MGDVTAVHPDRKNRNEMKETLKLLAGLAALNGAAIATVFIFF